MENVAGLWTEGSFWAASGFAAGARLSLASKSVRFY
jgi:hypothetical protein